MSDFLRRDDEDFDDLFEFADEETEEEGTSSEAEGRGRGFGSLFAKIRARRKAHDGGKRGQPSAEPEPAPTEGPSLDLEGDLWLEPPPEESLAPPLEEEAAAPAQSAPPPLQAEEKPRPKPRKRKPKAPGFWRQLTKGQRVVLSLLGVAVLIVYLLLGWAVWSSTRQAATPPPTALTVVVPQGTPMTTWEATPSAADEEEAVQPTPTPSPTPMVVASVSTKYDLQVYQHPDDVELRLKRGFEYLHLRAYEAAIADFEHVLELDAKNAQAYVGLGEAYFYLRRWKEAESAFETAISFDEHSEEAHYRLGYLYYWWGRYRQAAREFAWAAEINPESVRDLTWEALAYAGAGLAEEARQAVDAAFALDDADPMAYVARAKVRVLEGDVEGALGDLLYARELDPHNFAVLDALARFYAEQMPERAVEGERIILQAMNWARWDLEKAEALQTLGRLYLAEGRTEDARKAFTEASDLATADGRVVLPGLTDDLDRTLSP